MVMMREVSNKRRNNFLYFLFSRLSRVLHASLTPLYVIFALLPPPHSHFHAHVNHIMSYPRTKTGRINAKIARKDSLALKLAQRPDVKELMEKNILPSMTDEEKTSIRDRVSNKLNRRLSLRPTPEELEARNILRTQTAEELMIEKEHKKQLLDRKVSLGRQIV